MKQRWILTGAAFALATALTGCGGDVAANTQQQSSQELNDTTAPSPTQEQTQTEASPSATTDPTQSLTGTGVMDEATAQKIALDHTGVNAVDATRSSCQENSD